MTAPVHWSFVTDHGVPVPLPPGLLPHVVAGAYSGVLVALWAHDKAALGTRVIGKPSISRNAAIQIARRFDRGDTQAGSHAVALTRINAQQKAA